MNLLAHTPRKLGTDHEMAVRAARARSNLEDTLGAYVALGRCSSSRDESDRVTILEAQQVPKSRRNARDCVFAGVGSQQLVLKPSGSGAMYGGGGVRTFHINQRSAFGSAVQRCSL
jgi:hypothetical protein